MWQWLIPLLANHNRRVVAENSKLTNQNIGGKISANKIRIFNVGENHLRKKNIVCFYFPQIKTNRRNHEIFPRSFQDFNTIYFRKRNVCVVLGVQ